MADDNEHHEIVEVPPPAVGENGAAPPAEMVPTDQLPAAEATLAPDALAAEVAALKDRYLRLAAEYDNFRKRTTREREELRTRAQGDVVRRLLDALDDLGRVAHLPAATTTAADVIAGVELVERKLLKELGACGVEAVTSVNVPFDPAQHEAIGALPAETAEQDHTIGAVLQPGYRLGAVLLRPARVLVRIWTPPAET